MVSSWAAVYPTAYRPPITLPMLVPATTSTGITASSSTLSTPIWASPRGARPLNAIPTRARAWGWDAWPGAGDTGRATPAATSRAAAVTVGRRQERERGGIRNSTPPGAPRAVTYYLGVRPPPQPRGIHEMREPNRSSRFPVRRPAVVLLV